MQTGDDNDFQEDMPQSIWEEATQVSFILFHLMLISSQSIHEYAQAEMSEDGPFLVAF